MIKINITSSDEWEYMVQYTVLLISDNDTNRSSYTST